MTIIAVQKSLFGDKAPGNKESAPVFTKSAAHKPMPNLTLMAGLDKSNLRSESVYYLRILMGQYVRSISSVVAQKKFLKTIRAEIKLKQGRATPETLLMDALIQRNL
ncbi:MAG: hypothetical protein NTX76_01375 [Alphaproteobacteria bacterium]|nr:hypothetical protein [Alphaproteobacteria bacterium]